MRWPTKFNSATTKRPARWGRTSAPSVLAEVLHFFGEVEVVFGLWAVVLSARSRFQGGRPPSTTSARPSTTPSRCSSSSSWRSPLRDPWSARRSWIVAWRLGRGDARRVVAGDPHHRPGARVRHHRTGGDDHLRAAARAPVLRPRPRPVLKYATLGLLFVNVSIGGTLTHFAAPPVLMVARTWGWDNAFMVGHFGWRALVGILVSTRRIFRCVPQELPQACDAAAALDVEQPRRGRAARGNTVAGPAWIIVVHLGFMAWTVVKRTTRRFSSAASCLPRLRAGDGARSRAGRAAPAAARGILSAQVW